MKTITLIGLLIHISICCVANTKESSIVPNIKTDTIDSPNEKAIRISKVGTNKTFVLKKGRDVWMHFINEKGKIKFKRGKIIGIGEHEITVKPYSKKLTEKVYVDSDITLIGFTSAGRIIIAVIGTILLLIPMIILGLLTGYAEPMLIPYKKNISLEQTKKGNKKWKLEIVEVQ